MLELTPLRYFQAAYETGTFSASARLNEVSQPSVSAAIARLEAHLEGALFHRKRDGLVPTALGHDLYQQSGPVLSQIRQLETRLTGRVPLVLRVYCQSDIFIGSFQTGLKALQQENAELQFRFTDDIDLADLLFCSEDCLPRGCGFHRLWTEHYGVALPCDDALALASSLRLGDLQGRAIIGRPYCPSADQLLSFSDNGLSIVAEAVHDAQLLDLVAAGLGIAFVPFSHAKRHPSVVVRPLDGEDPVARGVGVGYRKTQFAASIAKAFQIKGEQL